MARWLVNINKITGSEASALSNKMGRKRDEKGGNVMKFRQMSTFGLVERAEMHEGEG
jgi:hypothetical protein